MLRGRVRGGAAFDKTVAAFRLVVALAGFTGFEATFLCFCVMSFNLAVKKKKVFGGKTLPKTSLFAQTPLFL
jgi:hypothetical protein